MIKIVALINKRPDITREEFIRAWSLDHPPLVQKLPGIKQYQQSHPVAHRHAWPWDGMAELWFDDVASVRTAFRTAEADAVRVHEESFIGSLSWFPVEEQMVFSGDQS